MKKNPGSDMSLVNFTTTFKEVTPVLHKLFPKKEGKILPNLFYEASITLMLTTDNNITRKLPTNISYEYIHTNSPKKTPRKQNPATCKMDYTQLPCRIYHRNAS